METMEVTPAARLVTPGCFTLPKLDPAIPSCLGFNAGRARTLSRFAHAAQAEGVPLPEGAFRTIEEVAQAQWAQYVEHAFAPNTFNLLPGSPEIRVTDDHLDVIVNADSRLNLFVLKPLVESLEASMRGLGWFVSDVVATAGSYGHQTYDMGCVSYFIETFHWQMDQFTDEEYARCMLQDQGQDVPDGPIASEVMDQLRQEYNFWPSQILAEVDGHAHLLHVSAPDAVPKPRSPGIRAIGRWVGRNRQHDHATAVADALALNRALRCARRDFVWNKPDDDGHVDLIGALGFIAWDSPSMLFEAVQHFEQNAYNGGEAVEAFARSRVALNELTTDRDLRVLARGTVQYLNRWALLEKLLSNFPIGSDDDED